MVSGRDDWENLYREQNVKTLPWYNPNLDSDLKEEIEKRDIHDGNFLDIGTGPGTQAMELAQMGFNVTATDISESAVKKAREINEKIEFLVDDILKTKITKKFDYAFDRGCFHVLPPEKRIIYSDNVNNVLNDGGLLFLKTFSTKETRSDGPYKISQQMIEEVFDRHFHIENIKDTEYEGTLEVNPKALFVVLRRR